MLIWQIFQLILFILVSLPNFIIEIPIIIVYITYFTKNIAYHIPKC